MQKTNFKHISFLVACFLLLLTACSDSVSSSSNKTRRPSNKTGQCLLSYRNHYSDLLSEKLIQKSYSVDFSKVEIDSSKFSKPKFWSLNYAWPAGEERKRRMKVGVVNMPIPYHIEIGGMSEYGDEIKDPVAYFKNTYRNRTAEEKKKAKKAIEEQIKKSDGNEKSKKMAKSLSKSFTSSKNSMKFMPIDGVGDAAAWDYFDHSLKVLVGRVQFQISVDVSDDEKKNQKVAKQLAKDLIGTCR